MFFLRPMASDVEVLNDVNGELINLYRVVKHHLEEFVRQFKWALSSRQVFKWLQATPEETLTDIQRAARFFYLQHSAFGGRVDGRRTGRPPPRRLGLTCCALRKTSPPHTCAWPAPISRICWFECIRRYDRPHFSSWIRRIGRPRAGVEFGWEQYERLAAVLGKLKGKAMVTLNDHPAIRALFAAFPLSPPTSRIPWESALAPSGVSW